MCIRDSTCTGNYDGISVSNSPGSSIVNNTCTGNYDGIVIFQSSNITIAGNVCDGNTYGILLSTDCDDNLLILNACSNNALQGITVGYSERNLLSNNICIQNNEHGIVIGTSANNTLFNNTCQDNGNSGILLENAHYNILDNNTCIADNPANGPRSTVGVKLYYSDHNEISRNICEHNGVGLILDSSNFNSISFNELNYNNYFMGLRRNINVVSSSNNNITNNSCVGADYGMSISGGDDIRIEGNDFSYNADKGIEIYNIWYDKARYLVANNTCNGNAYGIWVEGPLYDSRIINNTCEDNTAAAMYITYRSHDNIIANNTLANNGQGMIISGAGDDDCYRNTISNNTIVGNTAYGISITSSTRNHLFGNVLNGNNGATSIYDPEHVQAWDSGTNFWNDTTYGNLWADWTSPDADGDGIVDEAYLIDGGTSKDLLPLAISVAITSPADGFVTGETSVDISGTAVSYFGVDHLTWHNAATGASGDCSGTDVWTATVPLANGDNVITVTMVDLHGSEANASITVVLDVVPPTLEITYPAEGAYVGSSVTVTWIGSDADSGIAYYIVSIEGLFSVNVTESSYTINDLTEGTYTVLVSAYDAAGNYLGVSVSFTVDVTAPAVTIESPDDNFISTTNSITVTWNGSDTGSGVDRYEVSWEGGSPVTLLPSDSTYTFNGLSDGSHVLTVTVYDKAGLSSSDAVTVRVDTQPPSLTITYPVEGGYVANSDLTVTWSGFDAGTGVAYYTASIEGLAPFNTTGTSCTFNDLADGTYTVLVSAYDQLGNHRDVTATFTVDTVAPALAIDSPEEGQLLNSSSVTVSWNTTDDNPGTVLVRFDDEAWATATGEEFSKTALNDGHHTAYVKATDAAGNSVEGMVNFTVDTTAPTVAFISPGEGSLVNSSTGMVEWAVDDAVSSIRVDGGAWIELGPNTSWEYSLENGEHIIEVKVTDLAGNSAIATLNITVDTVAPEAEVSPIGDDLELDLVILVEFSEQMNQTSVSIVVPGVTGALDWEGDAVMFTPSVLYYNHEYAVQVTGKDLAGNGFEVNWTFSTRSVGNLTGVILDENGDPVSNVTVTAGGEFTAVTDENGRFVFLNLSVGTYLFEVDAEGYEPFSFNATVEQGVTSDQGTVEMVPEDTEGEEDDGGSSIWLYVIIAIVVLAVVGVVAFVFLRKK
jgi:parallel beta-helix repeat protein